MHGYNNFPCDQEYALCAWHPDKKAPAFWTSKVMVFGATASVNHFCRLPGLLERIGTRLAATIARAYVDDWITTWAGSHYWPKPSRCSKILSFLRNTKETNHMTPKAAQRLEGKMQFLPPSSLFGSVGRAQTSCIRRRAHSKCVVHGWQTDTSSTWHPKDKCRTGSCPSLMTNWSSYIPTARGPTSVSASFLGPSIPSNDLLFL
jgi:hypothetical protein